jgi:nicotinate dehydrogenase subunit B
MMPEMGRVVVNGIERELRISANERLLEWLRDELGLTGAKYGCGEGACGACSVLIDGALARACVISLNDVAGRSVTTIEGLARDGKLHPVQQAFVEAGAMQCGFCTPGMVVAAVALLEAHSNPTDDDIAHWMAPNVCRCCTYPRIVAAIRQSGKPREPQSEPTPTRETALAVRPRVPWDLVAVDHRDYFDVLGDGLVVVLPPPAAAPGTWAPTGGAWLHIAIDGAVTAFTGKVDVGQGTGRALCILVAGELAVSPTDVRLVMGDTDVCPFDIGTFGSLSMPTAALDLQRAAAAASVALRDLGPLAPGIRHVHVVEPEKSPEPATEPRIAVTAVGRGDPTAVTGAKRFASDVRRPGMQHGKVVRPPQLGAKLRSVDTSVARAVPGVTVVVDGELVGVVAPTLDTVRAALALIEAEWEPVEAVAEADLESYLRAHPVSFEGWGGEYAYDVGDVDVEWSRAAVQLARTYTMPYIAHAPIETRVALAEWDDHRLTVWTGTQQPFNVRGALARALDTREEDVRVIVPHTGTGFGGKHEPDIAIAAARLARAAGVAVRLQWTREEEFSWAYFRPAAIIDVRAGATSDGNVTTWEMTDINAGSAAIHTPYDVPNQRLRFQPAESPLRQGAYRALAATANNFARESFIDELAHELRADPLELRLRHLHDARLATVLHAAADRFGWESSPSDVGYGIGIAAGLEKGGRVATCVLVRVDDDRLEILRAVTAFECGAIVDRDNLTNQIEGATIMGLGGALFESVHFDGGRILNPSFTQYRVPRFTDSPPIEVILVDRPDLPSAGAGETPIITIAPALANAIFDATARRIRALPLLNDDRLRDASRD